MFLEWWWYFEAWQGPKNEIAYHLSHLNRALGLMQIHIGKSTHFATCFFSWSWSGKIRRDSPANFDDLFLKSVALSEKSRWKGPVWLIQSDLTWSVPWICDVLTNKRLERGYPPGTCPTSIKLGTFPHVGYFLFRRWVTSQNRFSQNVNMSWCSFLKATTKSPSREVWTILNLSIATTFAEGKNRVPRWRSSVHEKKLRWKKSTGGLDSRCRVVKKHSGAFQPGNLKNNVIPVCKRLPIRKESSNIHPTPPSRSCHVESQRFPRCKNLSLVNSCWSFSRPLHESFRPMNGKYKLLEEFPKVFENSVL